MRCPEFRDTMRRFIDGRVDSQTRKEVGLHLAGCEECGRLIEDGKFWDDSLLSLLDREAPDDLRSQILTDTVGDSADHRMSRRTQFRVVLWAATRKNSPKTWLETAAIVAGVLLFIFLVQHFK